MFKNYRNLWLALGVFMLLSPVGLISAGTAFGEWGLDELPQEVGFIPAGLEKLADIWTRSPLPDYGVPGLNATFAQSAGGYIISAVVGVALVVGVISLLGKVIKD